MADLETVQEYLNSGDQWLSAAKRVKDESPNPAAFNALHAIELIAKAAIKFKTGKTYRTHRIGGLSENTSDRNWGKISVKS